MIEAIASVLATLALAVTLYFSSLNRIKNEKTAGEVVGTKGEIDEIRAQMKDLSDENTRLKERVHEFGADNKKLSGQVDGLTNTLEVLRSEGRQTIIDYTQALRDLLAARMALATVEKQFIEASNRATALEGEKTNLIQANENLAKQLAENTNTLKESQSAMNIARQTIDELTTQKARLEGEITGLSKGYSLMQFVLQNEATDQAEEESNHE